MQLQNRTVLKNWFVTFESPIKAVRIQNKKIPPSSPQKFKNKADEVWEMNSVLVTNQNTLPSSDESF